MRNAATIVLQDEEQSLLNRLFLDHILHDA